MKALPCNSFVPDFDTTFIEAPLALPQLRRVVAAIDLKLLHGFLAQSRQYTAGIVVGLAPIRP